MTIKDKIQKYIDYKGISINKFEESIGVSKSYWRNTKSISAESLSSIVRIYSDLNVEWVLLDIGEMINIGELNKTPIELNEPKESISERLLSIIESQQRTIENLTETNKKIVVQKGSNASVADVG